MKSTHKLDWQHEVDRTLESLARIPASENLEVRILARLHRTSTHQPPVQRLVPAFAIFLIATAAATSLFFLRGNPPAAPSPASSIVAGAPVPARAPSPPKPHAIRHRHHAQPSTAIYLTSRPAPPQALTEQERLLLMVLHNNDTSPRELLDPILSASLLAREDAEFERGLQPTRPHPAPAQAPIKE